LTSAVHFSRHTGGVDEPCCAPLAETNPSQCPACGQRGTPVETQTVKALLTTSALQRLDARPLWFCAHPTCDTVYFGDGQRYGTSELRVPVWQKAPGENRMICYCFGENESDIRREIELAGASGAVSRVRGHIDGQRCACELRNPRGTCCLGDVIASVKRLLASCEAVSR